MDLASLPSFQRGLKSGCHQIRVLYANIPKTTFKHMKDIGSLRWCHLGSHQCPATFEAIMNDLPLFLGKCTNIYGWYSYIQQLLGGASTTLVGNAWNSSGQLAIRQEIKVLFCSTSIRVFESNHGHHRSNNWSMVSSYLGLLLTQVKKHFPLAIAWGQPTSQARWGRRRCVSRPMMPRMTKAPSRKYSGCVIGYC